MSILGSLMDGVCGPPGYFIQALEREAHRKTMEEEEKRFRRATQLKAANKKYFSDWYRYPTIKPEKKCTHEHAIRGTCLTCGQEGVG